MGFFLTRELRRHHVRTSWGNLDFIFVTVNGFEYPLPQPGNAFFLAPVRALLQINPPPRNVNGQTVTDQGCQEVLKTMLLLAGGLFLLWPHHHCWCCTSVFSLLDSCPGWVSDLNKRLKPRWKWLSGLQTRLPGYLGTTAPAEDSVHADVETELSDRRHKGCKDERQTRMSKSKDKTE